MPTTDTAISILDLLPIVLSAIAFVTSLSFSVILLKDRRNALRIAREREVFDWASAVLNLVPQLQSQTQSEVDGAKLKLSALTDLGRLFFPNDTRDGYGNEKHPLNRGYRSKILDPLIAIHQSAPIGDHDSLTGQLVKDFVFEVGLQFSPIKVNTSPFSRDLS